MASAHATCLQTHPVGESPSPLLRALVFQAGLSVQTTCQNRWHLLFVTGRGCNIYQVLFSSLSLLEQYPRQWELQVGRR